MKVRCLVDIGGNRKEVVGLGCLEELKNPRRYPGGDEVDAFALAADKVTDDESQAAGVHVGDFGEIKYIDRRHVVGRIGFEEFAQGEGAKGGIHVSSRKRAGKPENDRIGGKVLRALDGEGCPPPDLTLHGGH